MTKRDIAVLGAGNMGTAVAEVLARRGHRVWLWDYNPDTIEAIRRDGENKFLPGVKLSKRIVLEASMGKAVEKVELVVIACASPYVRTIVRHLTQCLSPSPSLRPPSPTRGEGKSTQFPSPRGRGEGEGRRLVIAHIAKGLEPKINLTMHEVVQSELHGALRRSVVTISGPSIAKEMVAGVPTAVVAASQDRKASEFVRDAFTSPTFKVACSSDFKGVSICGALKNVYAIALGMCDGMRLTFNAKSFMFTVALTEMECVAQSLGGKRDTVYGLAGVGDLVVTGLGDGRNRALGERICKEGHCKFVWNKSAQTHEGVTATKVFYEFARHKKITTPLLTVVYRVLYGGADPCKQIKHFFKTVAL